jgi:CPA2 family monovalent cation:H+ antiporter-2
MQYLQHPAIPGYVLAGLCITPFVDGTELLDLAQLGVLFLVFIFGLKFDPDQVNDVAQSTILVTVVQLVITGSIGYRVAFYFGLSGFELIVVSVVCALSSTLIGLELAEEEIHRHLLHGRMAESMHLVQDILGLFILAVMFSSTTSAALSASILTLIFIAIALSLRRHLFTFIGEFVRFNTEILMLLGFSSLLVWMYAASSVDLPLIVGAFTAGISAAKFPYNMELLDSLGSVKDFFSAIFFVVLGALVGFPSWETWAVGLLIFLVTVFIKPYIAAEAFKQIGYTERASVLTGLSLNQVSELSFILAIQSLTTGSLSQGVFEGIILGGVASMITSSYLKQYEEQIYRFVRGDQPVRASFDLSGHVVVIGGSRPGQNVVKTMRRAGRDDIIVVDNDTERLRWCDDVAALHGDIMNDKVLDAVNIWEADLIVSTALQRDVSHRVLQIDGPEKMVYADQVPLAKEFYDAGASFVIVPDIAVADVLREYYDSWHDGNATELKEEGKALLKSLYGEDFTL